MGTVFHDRGDAMRDAHRRPMPVPRQAQQSGSGLFLELPAAPTSVPHVRRLVGDIAERMGAEPERTADVRLAVTEACANVVVHAYAVAGGRLTVEATEQRGQLIVTICDTGRGLAGVSPNAGLGQGLSLINSLTDDLQIESGPDRGTRMRLVFRLTRG